MSGRKERLTVTVDPDLIAAGSEAVAAGRADSLSSWVNAALQARVARDRRLTALAAAVADYENEFGEITIEEIATQTRADRSAAIVVRGERPPALPASPTRRGRGAT
jgi:ribonuclease HII